MMTDLRPIYFLFVQAGLDAFEGKPLPSWLKDHKEFQTRNKINKVFPAFGLKNFKDKVQYKTTDSSELDTVISRMLDTIYTQVDKLYYEFLGGSVGENGTKVLHEIILFLRNAKDGIFNAITAKENGKTKILFDNEVKFGSKLIFRRGESVFHAFNKIDDIVSKFIKHNTDFEPAASGSDQLSLPNIDSLLNVKLFHKINVPNREYYVVFSGSGDEAAWDVCTMSSRGISSCQAITDEPGEYNSALIGSVLSRYVGIIYLTSGNDTDNKYGNKMIKRCLVRFAINNANNKEKVIILDKMYDSYDPVISKLFIEALQSRTNLKVLNYSLGENFKDDLPLIFDLKIPGEKSLFKLEPGEQPYKDLDFLTKYPESFKNKWKEDTKEVSKRLHDKRRDVYHNVASKLNYGVDNLIDEITGYKQKYAPIRMQIMYNLDGQLHALIVKTERMNISYNLRLKYIGKKMDTFIAKLLQGNIQEIARNLDLRFESESIDWEQLKNDIKIVTSIYRSLFFPMFHVG
jgi:hypothetical protein